MIYIELHRKSMFPQTTEYSQAWELAEKMHPKYYSLKSLSSSTTAPTYHLKLKTKDNIFQIFVKTEGIVLIYFKFELKCDNPTVFNSNFISFPWAVVWPQEK